MARSSALPTTRRTLMTKPQSSSTVSTATTWRERSAVPDTSGRGRRFHLCEFTPSYDYPFVGSAIGNTDLAETDTERLDTDIRETDLGTEPWNTSTSGFSETTPPTSETNNLNSGDHRKWRSPQIPATTRSPVPTSSLWTPRH